MKKIMKTRLADLTVGQGIEAIGITSLAATAACVLPFVLLIAAGAIKEQVEVHKKRKAKIREEETED